MLGATLLAEQLLRLTISKRCALLYARFGCIETHIRTVLVFISSKYDPVFDRCVTLNIAIMTCLSTVCYMKFQTCHDNTSLLLHGPCPLPYSATIPDDHSLDASIALVHDALAFNTLRLYTPLFEISKTGCQQQHASRFSIRSNNAWNFAIQHGKSASVITLRHARLQQCLGPPSLNKALTYLGH